MLILATSAVSQTLDRSAATLKILLHRLQGDSVKREDVQNVFALVPVYVANWLICCQALVYVTTHLTLYEAAFIVQSTECINTNNTTMRHKSLLFRRILTTERMSWRLLRLFFPLL